MSDDTRVQISRFLRREFPIGLAIIIVLVALVFVPARRATSTNVPPPTPTPPPVVAVPVSAATPVAAAPSSSSSSQPLEPPTPTPAAASASPSPPLSPKTIRAFAAAKNLFVLGQYAEAIPKFDALASTHPEAEIYAARSVVQLKSCYAAAPRYDAIIEKNAGTETASRTSLELARCYRDQGVRKAALKRYEKLTDDRYVGEDAKKDLAKLTR